MGQEAHATPVVIHHSIIRVRRNESELNNLILGKRKTIPEDPGNTTIFFWGLNRMLLKVA